MINYSIYNGRLTNSMINVRSNTSVFALFLFCAACTLAACTPLPTPTLTPTSSPAVTETPSPARASASTRTARPATEAPVSTLQPSASNQIQPFELYGRKVKIWHAWSGETERALQDVISEFNHANPWKIQAELYNPGSLDNLSSQLLAALQSGSGAPDLATGYTHQLHTWEAARPLADLTPYVEDPQWGLSPTERSSFYPVFWQQDVSGGKRLGVPAYRSGQLLYYNQNWARELGFPDPPSNPQEFKEQACAAARSKKQDKDVSNDATGGLMLSSQYDALLSWMYAFGSEIVQPEGRGYRFDTPQTISALRFLRQLLDDGCAWAPEEEIPLAEFASRQGLFATGSLASIPAQVDAFRRNNNTDQWTVIPFPSPLEKPALTVYGPSYTIPQSNPKQQLAAWLVARWLLQPEQQTRLIQASHTFPLDDQTLRQMQSPLSRQWKQAMDLLENARPEPALGSWDTVRWALADAATQLSRYYFTTEQVQELARLLNNTASELHQKTQARLQSLGKGVTPTP